MKWALGICMVIAGIAFILVLIATCKAWVCGMAFWTAIWAAGKMLGCIFVLLVLVFLGIWCVATGFAIMGS